MSRSWRTTISISQCLTCGWKCDDYDNPRVSSVEGTLHKREWPDHEGNLR